MAPLFPAKLRGFFVNSLVLSTICFTFVAENKDHKQNGY